VIGAVLMAVVGGSIVRSRLTIGLVVLVAGVVVLLAFGSQSSSDSVVKPLIKRGSSILELGKTEKESSLEDRARETEGAWNTAKDHLAIGIGPGVPFGVYEKAPIISGSFSFGESITPQLFIHNQYLYLILICGIPGLIAFLVFAAIPLLEALRRSPRDPAITGCAIGLAIILVSSAVAIYLTVPDMTPLIGLLAGVIIADREGPAAAGERSHLIPSIEPPPSVAPALPVPTPALNRNVSRGQVRSPGTRKPKWSSRTL
jgi:O-antigen ligase